MKRKLALAGALALPLLLSLHPGCRASRPEDRAVPTISLAVEGIPLLIPADTTQTATVWITVLREGDPAPDSTRIDLAASAGTLPAVVYTRDGLATAVYEAAGKAGNVSIVAQCQAVRDTTLITLF